VSDKIAFQDIKTNSGYPIYITIKLQGQTKLVEITEKPQTINLDSTWDFIGDEEHKDN
jgi:hypothetical protein